MQNKASSFRRLADKLYGGLPMRWPFVILYAVAAALLTTLFLLLPVFQGSSFERMGVHLEAWIFLAVILMTNCKSPLDAACKTFVFFLISQPLIYLLQVPFTVLGWGIFGYYRTWFFWTLLTFPMAWAGWYLRQKSWLSALILLPVLAFLAWTAYGCIGELRSGFPRPLLAVLFCLGQIVLYVWLFFPKGLPQLAGLAIPVVTLAAALLLQGGALALSFSDNLPDSPAFSEDASVTVEDPSVANIELSDPAQARVWVEVKQYGSTVFTVTDSGREYRYFLRVYEQDGIARTELRALNENENS